MEVRFEIPNSAIEYEPARDRLLELFQAAGLSEEAIGELELILEELLVNIISYAYDEPGTGKIQISAGVDGSTVTLEFRDRGRKFNPLEKETPDLDADIEDRPIGGLGIFLVMELASSVTYERVGDENVLRVAKG
ncbi:MAG: ATP-binding protein [Blastocatellia bacterium]|jgi:anti-sigma regulatory factor (Ser/Thr protein kinase)|nr:ATP-binding protein [Blastocatellia bacterium]